jgi:hypothetical protein
MTKTRRSLMVLLFMTMILGIGLFLPGGMTNRASAQISQDIPLVNPGTINFRSPSHPQWISIPPIPSGKRVTVFMIPTSYLEVHMPPSVYNPIHVGRVLTSFQSGNANLLYLFGQIGKINIPSGDRIVNIQAVGEFRDSKNTWFIDFRRRLPTETGDYRVR